MVKRCKSKWVVVVVVGGGGQNDASVEANGCKRMQE